MVNGELLYDGMCRPQPHRRPENRKKKQKTKTKPHRKIENLNPIAIWNSIKMRSDMP